MKHVGVKDKRPNRTELVTTSTGTKETQSGPQLSHSLKRKKERTRRQQVFGGSPHLEGYPAERLSVRGEVEVHRGVLVGRRRAAAVHAGGGEGQRT